jgi:undecaprenyl-diphosphatase
MDEHAFNAVVVAVALVVYGVAYIVVERFNARKVGASSAGKHARTRGATAATVTTIEQLSFKKALGIGAFQCLAIVPGTSRSGSTILGGLILGVSRTVAAEFSFFLAIPVMFGWSLLKVVKAFVLDSLALSTTEWGVFVVGVLVAFGVSVLAIKFLVGYIKKHSFAAFGWYRIVLGVVVLAYFALTGVLLG